MNESRDSAAAPGPVCRLRYQSDGVEREIAVGEAPLLIGRAPDCDLTLEHESVSRHHARVSHSRKGWTITDLESKNGIKVNSFRTDQQPLNDGDRIDLGSVRLQVSIGPAASNPPARVVFEDSRDPRLRTQCIDMGQLDSLLSQRHLTSEPPRTSPSPAEIEQDGESPGEWVPSGRTHTRQSGADQQSD